MALVRLACAALLALAACRASEAAPGSASGLNAPAGWKPLPAMATAARDAAKASGFVVDNAEAWGDPARGCYGATLALTTRLAKPAKLADELVQGIQSEPSLAGISVTDVVKPAPAAQSDVLALSFAKAPYQGKLRSRIAGDGNITMLVCFWNEREPQACEAACTQLLGGLP
jgi:hypothetical protein